MVVGSKRVRLTGKADNVVRSGPGSEYAIAGVYGRDASFPVIAKRGEWYGVRLSETATGWVHSSLCEEMDDLSGLEFRPNPRIYTRTGSYVLGGYAGAYAFDRKSNSMVLGGRLGYYVFDRIQAEAGVSWTHVRRSQEIVESLFDLSLESEDFHMLFYQLNVVWELLPGRQMVPFVEAGVGSTIFQGRSEASVNFGAGTTLFLSKRAATRWEVRDYRFHRDRTTPASPITTSSSPWEPSSSSDRSRRMTQPATPMRTSPARHRRWAAAAALVLLLHGGNAAAAARPPFAAHAGIATAAEAARVWADDAFLIYLENDEEVDDRGEARRWSYLYYSPRLDQTRGYSVRDGKIVVAEKLEIKLEAPPVSGPWIDSAAALEVAEKNGGREFRKEQNGTLQTMLLMRGAFDVRDPDRTTWTVIYRSPRSPSLFVVVDAAEGKVRRTWRG